jgi:hypothetical protein
MYVLRSESPSAQRSTDAASYKIQNHARSRNTQKEKEEYISNPAIDIHVLYNSGRQRRDTFFPVKTIK